MNTEKEVLALVDKAKAGDNQAFLELYQGLSPRVYGLLMRILRDPAEAQDGTQEVFLRVHQNLGRFEGRSLFSTWVLRIGVHWALSLKRKLRRWWLGPPGTREGWDQIPGGRGPEAETEIPLSVWRLLSPSQRAVVELRIVQEWPVALTAAALGVSEGTVKTQLHRALNKLRRELRDEDR